MREKRLVKRVILSFIPLSRIPILEISAEILNVWKFNLKVQSNYFQEILLGGKLDSRFFAKGFGL